MNYHQKSAADARRSLSTRHAVIDALALVLEGLPVSIKESGSLRFGDDVSNSQFEAVARKIISFNAQSTTACNFARSDIWGLAVKRYGGGIEFMKVLYGDTDLARRQAAHWKNLHSIGSRVPEQDRDLTRTWSYYRFDYNPAEPAHQLPPAIFNFVPTTTDDSLICEYEDRRGARYKHEFPLKPVRDAIIKRYVDPDTGVLDFDW